MILKGQLFLFLMFVAVYSFGQTNSQTDSELPPALPPRDLSNHLNETKEWQSAEYKIKFSVPYTWRKIDPNEGEIVSFASSANEIFALRPYKFVFPGTPDEIRQRLEQSLKLQYPKCKIVSSKVIKIGEIETDAADIILEGTLGTVTGLYRGISFHSQTNSFIIIYFYSPLKREYYEKTLDKILNSISFQ